MATTGWLSRLEPPPRAVDWAIFALVLLQSASGVLSLGAGGGDAAALFWFHGVAGLSLALLVGFKLRRVAHRVTRRRLWDRTTGLSVLTAAVALAALGTGAWWVLGGDVRVLFWTLLNVHVLFGLLLVPVVLAHLLTRAKRPTRADLTGRRTAVRYAGVLLTGAVLYRAQSLWNAALETTGAARRFTGSKPAGDLYGGDTVGGDFPVTSWVADDPDPVAVDDWRLVVDGLVESPLALDFDALSTKATRRAVLDCTSGWYTVQRWRGVRLGDLLAAAAVRDGARWVTVHSVTGYRWSFPLPAARGFLLATHVGDERLTHGHGAPLRLVAPDRRGFQWVKWVDRVEVRRSRDHAQWLAVLVSGLDGE
ncbi:MAG: molybdopterin-dependent oxidoreductase [Haloferacaceae archaeon]